MSEQPETTLSSTPPWASDPEIAVKRRTVLRAAGVGGAGVVGAAALAACGGASTPPTTGGAASSTSTAASSTTSSGSPTSSGSERSSASSSAAAPSGTPVKTADVPVGGGLIQGSSFVVTQPSAGQFKAFSPICTHQGCPVTRIQGGQIICPCHMSHFDISTGAPTADSQAKSPLPAKTATVSGDSVFIA